MVSPVVGGVGTGADRATPQSCQPARGQTQDVEVRQETSRTPWSTAPEENLCPDSAYYLTNGIVFNPAGFVGTPGAWRRIRVDVSPAEIHVLWGNHAVGKLKPAEVNAADGTSLEQRRRQ